MASTTLACRLLTLARDVWALATSYAQYATVNAPTYAHSAWDKARGAWALAVATYRVAVVQRFMASQDSLVYKVVALNEVTGADTSHHRSSRGHGKPVLVRRLGGLTPHCAWTCGT